MAGFLPTPLASTAVDGVQLNAGQQRGRVVLQGYRANLASLFEVELSSVAAEMAFDVTGTVYRWPSVLLARVSSKAQTLRRALQSSTHSPQLYICYQAKGRVSATCAGRLVEIETGDVFVYSDHHSLIATLSEFETLVLRIPGERLPEPAQSYLSSRCVLPALSGIAPLLGRFIETMLSTVERFTPAELDAAIEAVLFLVAGALAPRIAPVAVGPGAITRIRDEAIAFVRRNITEADLTPATIARQLKISRSNLYRACGSMGGVRTMVMRLRLERCMELLLDGKVAKRSLGAIAFAHGFRSEAHFSRSFRARFGDTPRKFAEMVEKRDYGWLFDRADQANIALPQSWPRPSSSHPLEGSGALMTRSDVVGRNES